MKILPRSHPFTRKASDSFSSTISVAGEYNRAAIVRMMFEDHSHV